MSPKTKNVHANDNASADPIVSESDNESVVSVESVEVVEEQVKTQKQPRGYNIHEARAKAVALLKERGEITKMKKESVKLQRSLEKEIALAEKTKLMKDLEDARKIRAAIDNQKPVVVPKTVKPVKPTKKVVVEESSDEEEKVVLKKKTVVKTDDRALVKVAYQDRLDKLRASMLQQMFGGI